MGGQDRFSEPNAGCSMTSPSAQCRTHRRGVTETVDEPKNAFASPNVVF